MIQTLIRNRLLLALCGILEAIISVVYLIMRSTDGPLTFHAWNGTVGFLGKLALAAGACTIAAGVWRSARGACWLLILNGLALAALGVIQYGFVRYRISFLIVAMLIIMMAVSLGILELFAARTLWHRRHAADGAFLAVAGAALVGFALAYFALVFGSIKIAPGSHADLLWLGSYFGLSAVSKMGLAFRVHGQGLSQSATREASPPLGRPKHAH